ncbi:unnamed protein product [Brassica napus]|uniref:(rape) hypothetical protein n=1 Tax=Brassica napus TaxID=3708 RepID=A0A816QA01_BRANA|nr:unnamed protein product [Brassica napus]
MSQGSSSKLHWIELIFPFVDIMEGIKKKELVSIGEQNTFISNSNEQMTKLAKKDTPILALQESSSSNQVQSWAGKLEKHQPVPAIQLMRRSFFFFFFFFFFGT